MREFFGRVFGSRSGDKPRDLDSVFRDLDRGEAERPLPTLVCRQCGLKYENTGTYLKGSPCPRCTPTG
jgi:predicted Zn-ribbon and HTH transcriptional regulator